MDLTIPVGSTSQRIPLSIQDAAAGDGSGLTGLTSGSAGLTCYYWRSDEGNAGATLVSLTGATRGTFTSSGFVEKDATNQPGEYEFGIPNAALVAGASWVVVVFKGAAGMVPRRLLIQLTPLPVFAKNTALAGFQFPMTDASGAALTGLTITAKRSINGGAYASCTNAASEISLGTYTIDLSAADLNGATIKLLFTAPGAVDQHFTIVTQAIVP